LTITAAATAANAVCSANGGHSTRQGQLRRRKKGHIILSMSHSIGMSIIEMITATPASELRRVLVPLLPFVERNKSNCLAGNGKVAENLKKAGWSWGCVSAIDSNGRTIWITDAHRHGKRFIVRSDEKLTAFVELESAVRVCGELY
jgi:hypothetical protein